jgi:hypothetical protein
MYGIFFIWKQIADCLAKIYCADPGPAAKIQPHNEVIRD